MKVDLILPTVMKPPPARLQVQNLATVVIPIWGRVPADLDALVQQGFGENRAHAYYHLAMAELRRLCDQAHEKAMKR